MSYSDVEGGWTGIGNIDVDPDFVAGSLQLSVGSPCIDTGDGGVVTESYDIAGNPRVVDGNGDAIAVVDMGAYEFQPDPADAATPTGIDVLVEPEDAGTGTTPVTIIFANITESGLTSLDTSDSGPAPPVGFQLGDPATYYEITTTAAYDGFIVVCIDYSGVSYSDPELLRLHHYEDGAWVDRTISNDTINQIICGEVTSLSPFAVFQDLKQLMQQLSQRIIDLNLQSGIENSLDAKLDAALKAIDDLNANNDVAAINTLSAFINAIEAQRGNKIPIGDADALIAAAQLIIDLLT
jgi:hypothetical protein